MWMNMQAKKSDAPEMCTFRINQPPYTSRIIWTVESKARLMDGEKCMVSKRPEIIWSVRHSPIKDPKFHKYEMLDGEGRSISDELIILLSGLDFRKILVMVLIVETTIAIFHIVGLIVMGKNIWKLI